jgi:hypothetical protein
MFDGRPARAAEADEVKRDGWQEAVHFDKITTRLKKLSYGLSQDHCDHVLVAVSASTRASPPASSMSSLPRPPSP